MTLGDRVVVMDRAEVQQCDPPMTIYRRPVNRFVAGFLGTPPMNFLAGRLIQDSGLWFDGEGAHVRVPEEIAGRLADHVGKDVVIGLRPEIIRFRASHFRGEVEVSDDFTIPVKINVVEPLGSQMDVYTLTSNNTRIVARVPAEPMQPDQPATLYVNMSLVHVFEPGPHGRNLSLAPAEAAAV
jgi:multiple sugar transport system ATP-binding protein